jgi:hypothetical protein
MQNMLRYYQSYDKLKPHDGCKELCHRLGFVSVLPHGPQLDIDIRGERSPLYQIRAASFVLLLLYLILVVKTERFKNPLLT